MDNYFMCYRKAYNGVTTVKQSCTRDLFLEHLNRNSISYYSSGENGNNIRLYYRLRNTGFKIEQDIYVGRYTYSCRTNIAEKPPTREAELELMSRLIKINKGIARGKFEYNPAEKQLNYYDHISLRRRTKLVNISRLSERFDEMINLPHFLLDVEYADFLLSVLK